MKRIVTLCAAMATAVLFVIPAAAQDGALWISEEYGLGVPVEKSEQQLQKDTCLLVAKNCAGEYESVPQRIEKLRKEIGKGTAVYTPDELEILNNQLIWMYSDGDNVF